MRTKDDPARSMRNTTHPSRIPRARPPRLYDATPPRRIGARHIGRNKCSQAVARPTLLAPISIHRSHPAKERKREPPPAASSPAKSRSQKRPLILTGGSKSGQRSRENYGIIPPPPLLSRFLFNFLPPPALFLTHTYIPSHTNTLPSSDSTPPSLIDRVPRAALIYVCTLIILVCIKTATNSRRRFDCVSERKHDVGSTLRQSRTRPVTNEGGTNGRLS